MFCGKCGSNIGDLPVCPHCGTPSEAANTDLYAQPPSEGYPAATPASVPQPPVQQPYPAYPDARYSPTPDPQEAPDPPKKQSKRGLIIALVVIIVLLLAGGGVTAFILSAPMRNYDKATDLKNSGRYQEAIAAFTALDDYGDSRAQITECRYLEAKQLLETNDFDAAKEAFTALGDYKDCKDLVSQCDYDKATQLFKERKFIAAKEIFETLDGYADSDQQLLACRYYIAKNQMENDPKGAAEAFAGLGSYKDSKKLMLDAMYRYCEEKKDYKSETVYDYMKQLIDAEYSGAQALYEEIYEYRVTGVFWNTDPDNTDQRSGRQAISERLPQVLHFTVEGGTPGSEMIVSYKVIWPNGKTVTNSFGESGTDYTLTLTDAPKGKLTVELYTDEGEQIGVAEVTVV